MNKIHLIPEQRYTISAMYKHGKKAEQLTKVAFRALIAYINHVHTITGDNGTEFADHQNIAKMLKTSFFFTHPYSPWEKGAVENSNKLIRQYIPKKTNFGLCIRKYAD